MVAVGTEMLWMVTWCMSRHVSLKVFALDQMYLELAHDVLEVEADRGVGCWMSLLVAKSRSLAS